MTVVNPILPGFHPDPSVCRVGDDFYLVNSTFAYFPGIPVYHSRDLAVWTQIGNVLDRPGQLPLDGAEVSRGIFAATIRYHDGVFYVITTNVDHGGNFLVTATDPTGPWSDPIWLPQAEGIDPSLFFDEGRVWYCGTRPHPGGPSYFGDWEVWVQELDPRTWTFVGEPTGVWWGALRHAVWPEGPHLYKKDDWYYLVAAEGGTERNHAVSVARSRSVTGPFEGKAGNPIVTHRDMGHSATIVNVGHADLFDGPDGRWWMVLLASRPYGGPFCNLGRETFLVPVGWEDGWPVVNPGVGRVESRLDVPGKETTSPPRSTSEPFAGPRLGPEWLTVRTPSKPVGDLTSRPGWLRLSATVPRPGDRTVLSLVGRRQQHQSFRWSVVLEFSPDTPEGAAGLILFQNDDAHLRFERLTRQGVTGVAVTAREAGTERPLGWAKVPEGRVTLEVTARYQDLQFTVTQGQNRVAVAQADGRLLSSERAGGFVGTILGVFATGGGAESRAAADFTGWSYGPLEI